VVRSEGVVGEATILPGRFGPPVWSADSFGMDPGIAGLLLLMETGIAPAGAEPSSSSMAVPARRGRNRGCRSAEATLGRWMRMVPMECSPESGEGGGQCLLALLGSLSGKPISEGGIHSTTAGAIDEVLLSPG